MNEKILVEGKFLNHKRAAVICFVIAGIAFVMCFIVATVNGGSPSWAFRGIEYGYYWFFIGTTIFVVLGIFFSILSTKFELTITDSKVVGKTIFGKRVELPISQISATGTGMFKRVSIATSSGHINFYGVANQNEVLSALSELLIKRQEETKTATVKAPESNSDELKKYKELLDSGVITQEEFDTKKKQILGI